MPRGVDGYLYRPAGPRLRHMSSLTCEPASSMSAGATLGDRPDWPARSRKCARVRAIRHSDILMSMSRGSRKGLATSRRAYRRSAASML